jgi:hypothetical protein
VDWTKINKRTEIGNNSYQIIPALNELIAGEIVRNVYTEWSDGGLPSIRQISKILLIILTMLHESLLKNLYLIRQKVT